MRHMNKELGKSGIPASKKSKADRRMMEPPVSVLFVDNTKAGKLAKMLQKVEKRLDGVTAYRVSRHGSFKTTTIHQPLGAWRLWTTGLCGLQPAG